MKLLHSHTTSFITCFLLILNLSKPSLALADSFSDNCTQKILQSLKDDDLFYKHPLIPFLAFCTQLAAYFQNSTEQEKKELCDEIFSKKMILEIAQEYAHTAFATLCHECGHAFAGKILNGDPINIHLGSTDIQRRSLASIGPVTINGINSMEGYAELTIPYKTINKRQTIDRKKYGIMLAAGGIAGLIGSALFKTGVHLASSSPSKGSLKNALLTCDLADLCQLQNLLLPLAKGTDAYKLYEECFGVNNKHLDLAIIPSHLMMLTAFYYITYKKTFPQGTTQNWTSTIRSLRLPMLKQQLKIVLCSLPLPE